MEDDCCGHPPAPSAGDNDDNASWDEDKVLDLCEMYWRGHPRFLGTDSVSPKGFPRCMLHQFHQSSGCRLAFILSFANVTVIETADGLVLVDSGHSSFAKVIKK